MKRGHWKSLVFSGIATFAYLPAAHAGWESLPTTGTPVLHPCNPKPFTTPTPATCLLTGADLISAIGAGYILKYNTASVPININGVQVGLLYDRVYCIGTGSTCTTVGGNANTYILATRVRLNSNAWNGHSSESFEINDTIRAVKSTVSVDAGYYMGPPGGSISDPDPDLAVANLKWTEYVGRTQWGLNEALVGTRDNAYTAFRHDINANDPDGVSSEWGAWHLIKIVCSGGVSAVRSNFSIKLWEGGEESQDHYTQWMSGYRCT